MTRRAGVLARARRAAEDGFDSTCRITRPTGERGPIDPETLKYPEPPRETIYEGPCRVQDRRDLAQTATAGEREVTIAGVELQLPIDGTENVALRDDVQMLTNPSDPAVVGRHYSIAGRHEKTHASARRLPVVEVIG